MKAMKKQAETEAKEASQCRVVVAYEDDLTRGRCMSLLGSLQSRFSSDLSFEVTWWRFRYLHDPEISLIARHYAAAADVVIFSSDLPGLFPLSIMNWIESWTEQRRKEGGVLVPLIGSPHIPTELYVTKRIYLKRVAERAGLDYLPPMLLEPRNPTSATPPSRGEVHPKLMGDLNHARDNASMRSD